MRSFHQRLAQVDHAAVQALLDELAAGVDAVVRRAAPDVALRHKRVVFMRYSGQGHEIPVDLPDGPFDAAAGARLAEAFAQRYAQLYGRNLPHVAVEAVSWSIAAQAGERRVPEADRVSLTARLPRSLPGGHAQARRLEGDGWIEAPCFERAAPDAE